MWRVQFLHLRQDQFVSGHPGNAGPGRTAARARWPWVAGGVVLAAGLAVESWSQRTLGERAPYLGPSAGAIWLPDSAQVEPAKLHARLTDALAEVNRVRG